MLTCLQRDSSFFGLADIPGLAEQHFSLDGTPEPSPHSSARTEKCSRPTLARAGSSGRSLLGICWPWGQPTAHMASIAGHPSRAADYAVPGLELVSLLPLPFGCAGWASANMATGALPAVRPGAPAMSTSALLKHKASAGCHYLQLPGRRLLPEGGHVRTALPWRTANPPPLPHLPLPPRSARHHTPTSWTGSGPTTPEPRGATTGAVVMVVAASCLRVGLFVTRIIADECSSRKQAGRREPGSLRPMAWPVAWCTPALGMPGAGFSGEDGMQHHQHGQAGALLSPLNAGPAVAGRRHPALLRARSVRPVWARSWSCMGRRQCIS